MRATQYWESSIDDGPLGAAQIRQRQFDRLNDAIHRCEANLSKEEDREHELTVKVTSREAVGRPVPKRLDAELVSVRDRIERLQVRIWALQEQVGLE